MRIHFFPAISIHALLAESDPMAERIREVDVLFLSTLSLRRATWMQRKQCWCMIQFLSTLSLRRATAAPKRKLHLQSNFYPRSPCGERPSDGAHPFLPGNFYPRSPCGERPIIFCKLLHGLVISIHALLAESDTIFAVRPYDAPIFLSTLSLRRATIWSH